ncbi:hypothetical protein CK203_117762 [Vitis vinifera]|uniref:Reverse transcriptase domain-containing protein n=1 Tax=Vitis vinifera TaxID=29760 RepID=A0A438F8R5_VITVI|nr:hypothetical protein CK203_117762 [Vitis vinifera]
MPTKGLDGEILTLLKRMKERKYQKGKMAGRRKKYQSPQGEMLEELGCFRIIGYYNWLAWKWASSPSRVNLRITRMIAVGFLQGFMAQPRGGKEIAFKCNKRARLNSSMKMFSKYVLPRPMSDHFPLLLDGGGPRRGPFPFIFESMWLKEECFKDLLKIILCKVDIEKTYDHVDWLFLKLKKLKGEGSSLAQYVIAIEAFCCLLERAVDGGVFLGSEVK